MRSLKKILGIVAVALIMSGCGGGENPSNSDTNITTTDTSSVFDINKVSDKFYDGNETETVKLPDGREVLAMKNEILIYFSEELSKSEFEAIVNKAKSYGKIVALNIDLLTMQLLITDDESEADVITELKKLSGVSHVGLNTIETLNYFNDNIKPQKSEIQYQKAYYKETGNNDLLDIKAINRSFDGDYWIDDIHLREAWKVEDSIKDLSTVTLGITDTGIPKEQTVISESRLERYDQLGLALKDNDTFDVIGHGTAVTAFAAGESSSVVGVSRKSKVIHIDTMNHLKNFWGWGWEISKTKITDVASSINKAINKDASIINISIGQGSTKCNDTKDKNMLIRAFRDDMTNVLRYAAAKKVLTVWSAGNECEKHYDKTTNSDSNDEVWKANAIIVGASNKDHKDAFFGIMGKAVDILAPGRSVGYGETIINGSRKTTTTDGTSFASPITAGVATMIKGVNNTLMPPEIKYIIKSTGEKRISFMSSKDILSNMKTFYKDIQDGVSYTQATAPNLLLNAESALKSAKMTKNIPLEVVSKLRLKKDETKTINITYKVPNSTVKSVDIVFLVDVSGSYDDDIETLKSSMEGIIDSLSDKDIDVQYGVASFADFPLSSYGASSGGDEAFYLNKRITSNKDEIIEAISNLNNPLIMETIMKSLS